MAFAGSDSALKPEEATAAQKRCQGSSALNLPMVVGPVAVVYNLQGVDGLKLSPETIASIFSGKIKNWNDPAIAKENQGATLPGDPIKPVYRSDESGTTDNFTDYLNTTAPKIWTWEKAKKWPNSTGQGAPKSDGVTSQVKSTAGAISYVEMSYATNNKLQTAQVKNGAASSPRCPRTARPRPSPGRRSSAPATTSPWRSTTRPRSRAPTRSSWSPTRSRARRGCPAEQAGFVKSFLTYTSSADGQKVLTDHGYAPLPQSVLTKVQASVKALS